MWVLGLMLLAGLHAVVDLLRVGSTTLGRGDGVDELGCGGGNQGSDAEDGERVLFELFLELGQVQIDLHERVPFVGLI